MVIMEGEIEKYWDLLKPHDLRTRKTLSYGHRMRETERENERESESEREKERERERERERENSDRYYVRHAIILSSVKTEKNR